MILPDLRERRLQSELMDDPALDERRHHSALRALETVNGLSWSAGRTWREIRGLELVVDRPIRVLDIACGGGDVVLSVLRRAEAVGLPVEIHGCDRSRVALDFARQSAADSGSTTKFFELDVLNSPLPNGYDLICCSLFLHHLDREEAIELLRRLSRAAPAVFVQDLRRTRLGHLLARVALHTLARSDVARIDALRSVEGAFTLRDVAEIIDAAGLKGAEIRRAWPQRFALSWRRS